LRRNSRRVGMPSIITRANANSAVVAIVAAKALDESVGDLAIIEGLAHFPNGLLPESFYLVSVAAISACFSFSTSAGVSFGG